MAGAGLSRDVVLNTASGARWVFVFVPRPLLAGETGAAFEDFSIDPEIGVAITAPDPIVGKRHACRTLYHPRNDVARRGAIEACCLGIAEWLETERAKVLAASPETVAPGGGMSGLVPVWLSSGEVLDGVWEEMDEAGAITVSAYCPKLARRFVGRSRGAQNARVLTLAAASKACAERIEKARATPHAVGAPLATHDELEKSRDVYSEAPEKLTVPADAQHRLQARYADGKKAATAGHPFRWPVMGETDADAWRLGWAAGMIARVAELEAQLGAEKAEHDETTDGREAEAARVPGLLNLYLPAGPTNAPSRAAQDAAVGRIARRG